MAAYQKELIETHYQEVDNMYRQMRGWRHDYRNHIQTMKAYAATENWDAIRHYLDLLDKDLTTVDTVIKTGNAMTDAILNSKISLARSKDIQVIADADIPVKLNSSLLYYWKFIRQCHRSQPAASQRKTTDPHLYGHEKHAVIHFFH